MGYLSFEDKGTSPSGLTRRWQVKSKQGEQVLGWIEWKAQWRKYVFSPTCYTVWDAGCLADVTEFLNQEMAKR
jgi:hypothetical protein